MTDLTEEQLAFAPASELALLVRSGDVSSSELVRIHFDRIGRYNAELCALVTLDEPGAHKAAADADAAVLSHADLGPLHGVPITIKDCFDVATMRTTVGDKEFANYVPVRDAPIVERLRAAGAIIIGRSNVPARLGDLQTCNDLFGCSHNPWDHSLTPGGSGGGAAAALAAGLTALEVGGDYGGSTRIPASHCGVYGLKASFGVIPCLGMLPLPPGHCAEPDMESPGPMGRSVEDLKLGLEIMAGPYGDRATGWRLDLPPARRNRLQDYRIAVWPDDESIPTDSGVRAVVSAAVERLSGAGAQFVGSPPWTLAEVVEVFMPLAFANIGAGLSDQAFEAVAGDRFVAPYYRDWFLLNERRHRLRAECFDYFKNVDAILAPCAVSAAHPISPVSVEDRTIVIDGADTPYLNMMAWAAPANALYLPSVAVPAGQLPDGRRVGIQVMAGYLEDRTALDLADHMTDVLGGFEPPPAYTSSGQ